MKSESPLTVNQLPPEVVDAIRNGSKVQAIKILRLATGIGLANAKVLVDEAARREGLQREYPIFADQPNSASLVLKVLLVAAIAIAVYQYWLN